MKVQIFIEGEEITLFKDESIEVFINALDVEDTTKRKTDYSKSFKVPASKNNNRIFTHFYNTQLIGGFNANVRKQGKIKIGGVTFREGVIQLNGVSLKNTRPDNYSIGFFSSEVGLKDLIGGTSIKEVDNGTFNYGSKTIDSYNNVVNCSLLSAKQLYYGNSGDFTNTDNLVNLRWNGSGAANYITNYDCRYSVNVKYLLDKIFNHFSISYENELDSNELFTDLFFALDYYDGEQTDNGAYTKTRSWSDLCPDIDCFTFVRSILNIFNCVLVYEKETYKIISTSAYYSSGKEIDISRFVDDSSTYIARLGAPKEIEYQFKEPSTAAQKQFKIANDRYYGDIKQEVTDGDGNQYIGKKKVIKLETELVLPERLNIINTTTQTPIQYCLLADDGGSVQESVPFFHYIENIDLSGFDISFRPTPTNSYRQLTEVNIPTLGKRIDNKFWFGLTFKDESNTYNGELLERNIYTQFHYGSTLSLYDENNRTIELSAQLPYNIFLQVQKNDVFVIKGLKYRIDNIKYNLITKKAKLKLYVKIQDYQYPFIQVGEFSNGFSNGFFK